MNLRAKHVRIFGELEAARARLPELAAAASSARDHHREAQIGRALDPGPDADRLFVERRDLLARASEIEATALAEADALEVALERVRAELEQATREADSRDAARVRAAVNDPARLAKSKAALLSALDHLYLRDRMNGGGIGANSSALVAQALGLLLDGASVFKRSELLFAAVLAESKFTTTTKEVQG
ncbi:MAG: hypothetical protein QM704_14860 [Anaeromyxobacteraceae bacterium]